MSPATAPLRARWSRGVGEGFTAGSGRAGRGRAMRYRRGCTLPRQMASRQQDGCHDGFLSRDTHQSDGSLEHKWRVGMRSPSRAEPRTNSMTHGVCFGEISVTLYRYMASDVDKLPR